MKPLTALTLAALSLALALTPPAAAQDVGYLVDEGEKLEKELKEEEAFRKYREALKLSPNHLPALVRNVEMNCTLGMRQTDKDLRKGYLSLALEQAQKAHRTDSLSPDANYAMALALSRMMDLMSVREKVNTVQRIRDHADSALRRNPDHVRTLYTLGRWHQEVSALGTPEKAAIRIATGNTPRASLPEAVECFEKVRRLAPFFVANYLSLAEAYKASGRSDKAIEALERMQRLPPRAPGDPELKAKGRKLLDTLY
jgi:tetratricopeptide (TPR) repeat protein